MTESDQSGPRTGESAVDEALAGLDGLAEHPVSEHHDRLSRAHEALHDALHAVPAEASDPSETAASGEHH